MIHVVDASTIHRYAAEMEAVWRLRHRIFVEGKGWQALARPDGREIDQFDTSYAVHFLLLHQGALIGYSRLLPTTKPHLLSEVFPHLCERERPVGPHVWEWTRQAVAPEHRAVGSRKPVPLELMTGIVEWGLAHGVSSIVAQLPVLYLTPLLQCRFKAEPLGHPTVIDRERIVAVEAKFDEATLRHLREVRGDETSALAPAPERRHAA
ncbi:acyl-homoserine-lactone synthase [Methylobacterium sp. JK268]